MTNLINVEERQPQVLHLKADLHLNNPKVSSVVFSKSQCNINDAMTNLFSPRRRKWKTVNILKNSSIHDDNSSLSYLLEKAVIRNKVNTITTPVKHISS